MLDSMSGCLAHARPTCEEAGRGGHRAHPVQSRGNCKALIHPTPRKHRASGIESGFARRCRRLEPGSPDAHASGRSLLREIAAGFPPPTRSSPAVPSPWRKAPGLRGSSPCRCAARRSLRATPSLWPESAALAADTCGAWAEFPLDPLPPGAASLQPATGGPRAPSSRIVT